MTHEEIKIAVDMHELWLSSNGRSGERGNFVGVDLSGAKFIKKDLRDAIFFDSKLTNVDFSGSILRMADFSGADFYGAILYDTYLFGIGISHATNIFTFNKPGGRTCYAVVHPEGLMIKAGCFWGTLDDFEEKDLRDNKGSYKKQIAYLRSVFCYWE